MAKEEPPVETSTHRVRAFVGVLRRGLLRSLRAFRYLRVLGRPAVFVPIVVAALLGLDAWLVSSVSNSKAAAASLEAENRDLGDSVAAVNTLLAENYEETAMLAAHAVGMSARTEELTDEVEAAEARMNALRDVAYDYEDCADRWIEIFYIIDFHSIMFVTELTPQAVNHCNGARTTLDELIAEDS